MHTYVALHIVYSFVHMCIQTHEIIFCKYVESWFIFPLFLFLFQIHSAIQAHVPS